MDAHLSWDEIRQRYPDCWVVLVDLDADDETNEVHGGVVFDHGKSRKRIYARVKEALAGKSRAVLFTGEAGKGNYLF